MDKGAAIETILGAEQRQQITAVALFDGALNDDEQALADAFWGMMVSPGRK